MTYASFVLEVVKPAQTAVWKAIRDGMLVHPRELACAVCDARTGERGHMVRRTGESTRIRIGYHHHDYAAQLWVTPLCSRCHTAVHMGRIPDPATGERTRPPPFAKHLRAAFDRAAA